MRQVLEDWRSAPVDEKLRATLGFLEKLTVTPHDVGPEDIEPLRASGLSDNAIEDAILVCTLFNSINRVSDALGFDLTGPKRFTRDVSDGDGRRRRPQRQSL